MEPSSDRLGALRLPVDEQGRIAAAGYKVKPEDAVPNALAAAKA